MSEQDSRTPPKRPRGRPKKYPFAPSKKERLVAAGKYEEYKANASVKTNARKKRTLAEKKVKEGTLSKDAVEAWIAGDPETRAAAMEAAAAERTKVTVHHAVKVELARRELARRKLIHYIPRMKPDYIIDWVHIELCSLYEQFIQDVVDKKSPRVMCFVPPRTGKSEIFSVQGPSWALGRYPWLQFINTSYAESLQLDFSRRVQENLRSQEWKTLFPGTVIDRKNEAVSDWTIAKHNGGILATGIGGPVTGRGAHALMIDDPVKNREEADSPLIRQSNWDWYTSTAYTRLAPGAGIFIVQTRWHDDDLSGRIEKQMEEAQKEADATGKWPVDVFPWKIVRFPAIATEDEAHRKKGEVLNPKRYSEREYLVIKRTVGPRDWAALYQQDPVPEEGAYFSKDSFRWYEQLPPDLTFYAAGDLAISKKESADYSVFVVVGVDREDNIYVVDVRRGRWDSMEIIEQMFDVYRTWKTKLIGLEKGQIEMAIGPFLERRIAEERLWNMAYEPLPPGKRDKEMRARPIQGRAKQGKLWVPRGAAWVDAFVNELLRFPTGTKDDQVDSIAWIGQMLEFLRAEAPPPRPVLPSWKDKLHRFVSGGPALDPMAA